MSQQARVGFEGNGTSRAKTLLRRADPSASSEPFSAVDPREVIDDAFREVRGHALLAEVPLVAYCDCEDVWLKRRAFAGALVALLDNAIRASFTNHPVILDVREIEDGDVLWQIQDRGAGLSPEGVARLGEPCRIYQSGIRNADAVVQEHGGLLRFESARGVGTTVTVLLPSRPARG